jgi:DNA (cytosine-5)-methyltransferase 1
MNMTVRACSQVEDYLVVPSHMRVRTLDLFCGGGGSSWGAQAAGAEIVCGVDGWKIAAETFGTNFPGAKAIHLTMNEGTTPGVIGLTGGIDLILSSPECTNHTCAKGRRERDEESKRTAFFVLNFARELKPRWIVLENVLHMRNWNGYNSLVAEIETLGYLVRPQELNASDFGVPQSRRRLFLLCDREAMPSEVCRPGISHIPVRVILDPEGTWTSTPLYNGKRAKNTLARAERAMEALGRGVSFLIVYYGSDGSGGWQLLDRPIRTLTTLDRFGLVTWDGDTPMFRMLQVPELRRAMGFSQEYVLDKGSRRDKIRLLGNGVCPPVMEAVIRSLVECRPSIDASCRDAKSELYNQCSALEPEGLATNRPKDCSADLPPFFLNMRIAAPRT